MLKKGNGLFRRIEHVLCHAAERTFEIFGDIFPFRAGGDALFGTALFFVVFPAADRADVFHNCYLRILNFISFILREGKENYPFAPTYLLYALLLFCQ